MCHSGVNGVSKVVSNKSTNIAADNKRKITASTRLFLVNFGARRIHLQYPSR